MDQIKENLEIEIVNEKEEKQKQNDEVIVNVKGKDIKLVLDSVALEYAEDLLDESVAGIFIKMLSGMDQESLEKLDNIDEGNFMEILSLFKLPKVKEMKAIIVASSKRFNHGIKDKDVLESLEDLSVFDLFSIVMPLLMQSKILPRA